MNLRIVCIGLTLLLPSLSAYGTEDLDTARYENRIRLLVMTAGGDKTVRVHEAIATTLEQLRSNKASKYLDPEEKGILSGMKFTYHRDNANFGLSFGPEFLDTYTPKSSTHLAILVHEIWHLRDFVKQHDDFYNAEAGSRTRFWYEIDAFHVEAEFIRDYLQKSRQLTRFNSFVLQSFQRDNLDSVAIMLQHQSLKVFFNFLEIDRAFNEGEQKGLELMGQISSDGKKLIEKYQAVPPAKEFESYFAYREVISFRNQMLKTLPLLLQNPSMKWDSVFQTYPDIGYIYQESLQIEKDDNERQLGYFHKIVSFWEDLVSSSKCNNGYTFE